MEEPAEFKSFYKRFIQSIEYRIYQDLKEKGFYITMGTKYGVNFLLYEGI
jgi:tRNA splicing endonuclease